MCLDCTVTPLEVGAQTLPCGPVTVPALDRVALLGLSLCRVLPHSPAGLPDLLVPPLRWPLLFLPVATRLSFSLEDPCLGTL